MEITTAQDFENRALKRQKRSLRPCDACRKRKSKCITKDGGELCVHCELRDTECTFHDEPPERDTRRLSNNAREAGPLTGSERSSALQKFRDTEAASAEFAVRVSLSPSIEASATAQDATQDNAQHVPTLGSAPTRFAELYGLGSDMEPILMRFRPYHRATQEYSLETHAIRRVAERDGDQEYPLTFHMASDDKAIGGDAALEEAKAVAECVGRHGPRLVELFWRHVHPCYPILAKVSFTSAYKASPNSIPAALLGAVYLSALRWWTYDPELSIREAPDAAHLRRLLKKALQSSYHRPKLSSIQAALLLLQCQPEDPLNPDHTYDWGLTCQALAVGQCLGLHLDASHWIIPQWERNVRKRLSWALYMQDRWTALAYGRPVHIHDDDWTVEDLTAADFSDDGSAMEEWQGSMSSTGRLQYIQMVQLARMLSTVLSAFYTARASRDQDTVLLYQRAQPLLDMLTKWYSTVPPSLQMHIIYPRRLSFHGYLHFSYHGVLMTILRRLVRSTVLQPKCINNHMLSEIRQISLNTAQNAITFVTSLRPDQLQAFWYFTTPYLFSLLGSFTTLLLVTSLSSQERTFWQETLNSYLWTLRTLSKSCEPMQYAVNRLEGAILRGLEHALAVNLNEPLTEDNEPMASTRISDINEFTDFGEWDLAIGDDGTFNLLNALAIDPEALLAGEHLGG